MKSPDCKVLTNEEYESLLATVSHKTSTHTPTKEDPVTKTKVLLPQATDVQEPKVTFANPVVSPVPRLQLLLNTSPQLNTSKQLNTCYVA